MNYDFKENTLLICPDSFKQLVLKYNSEHRIISNVKFETLESYRKNYFFDYGIKEIKFLMDNYGLSVDNAKEVLSNLYYVDEKKTYNNKKLDLLVSYKKELLDNQLLIFNPIFKKVLANKNVVVAGYGKLKNFDQKMLDGKNVEIINNESTFKNYLYYSFKTIEQEVEFLYNSIFDLLEKNVDINKIFIVNATSEYEPYFKRFNSYYPFTVELKVDDCLMGTTLGKQFFEMVLTGNSKEEIYELLCTYSNPVSDKLINILNKYCDYELNEVIELISFDLQNSAIPKENCTNVVKQANINDSFSDNEYVFLLGFNDKTPAVKADTDYITNNIRGLVGLDTTEQENILIKENYLANISNIKNLTISYCANTPFDKFNPSTLINESWSVNSYKASYHYSELLNKMKYAYRLDDLFKYNAKNDELGLLYHNYGKNEYQSYNNSFSGLSDKQISEIKNQTLSYSSMNSYYQCSYRYYLEKILGINKVENLFVSKLGTLCHDVLQQYCTNPEDFDFEKAWNDNIIAQNERLQKTNPSDAVYLNEMEHFFTNKVKEEIKIDIAIIHKQKNDGILELVKCENKFEFKVTDRVKFKGYIDKVMYHQGKDGNDLISIIDYKTGNSVKINPDLFKYGLSLQLPSYLYLMKHSKDFDPDHITFGGYYLQHIINSNLKYDPKQTREQIKARSMKLDGYSNADINILMELDGTLESGESENIKSIKLKKDGNLSSLSKVITNSQIDELIALVDEKVNEAANNIISANYSINPKIINGENKSCQFCPYLAICYRRDKDKNYIFTNDDTQED